MVTGNAQSSITTLIDKQGREIQSQVLALDGDNLKVRIVGRGNFDLKMEQLSEETQAELRAKFLSLSVEEQKPIMITPGKSILSLAFTDPDDKMLISPRKNTRLDDKEGELHVLPPETEGFARAGLLNFPTDYVCQFRWKYNKPSNPTQKSPVYFDAGHRAIRVTFTKEGATLLLENHLVGNDAAETSIVLQAKPQLTLEPDKWYDITVEIKGDEVVYQINGHVLYGRNDLIAGERSNTFNIDAAGSGYVMDEIEVWGAGEHRSDWEATRAGLTN